jgi:NADH dehydrogenase
MKLLITGATGVIGARFIQKLRQNTRYEIRILIRSHKIKHNEITEIETVPGELNQADSLIRASSDIDTIIHLAAITHTHETGLYHEVNLLGTERLIQAAKRCGVRRFIFLSTKVASYSGGGYARSKILAEECVRKSGFEWVIIRPAEVYGAGGSDSIQKTINIVKNGYPLPILGKGDFTLAPVFVDDVVNGIIATIDNPAVTRKIICLNGPKEYSFVEMVEVLENHFGKKILKVYLPVLLAKMLAYLLYLLKSDLLYRDQIHRLLCPKTNGDNCSFDDLGIQPRRLEETIETICQA